MAEGFTNSEPFGIDDGELEGLTPQNCFVLGFDVLPTDKSGGFLKN